MSFREFLEATGVIGVVLSLIFVGLELRQSSQATRLESHQAYVSDVVGLYSAQASDPVLSGLVGRAFSDEPMESFAGDETTQLFAFYLAHVHTINGLFQSVQEGILDSRFLEIPDRMLLFRNSFFRSAWSVLKNSFDPEFIAFFESLEWYDE